MEMKKICQIVIALFVTQNIFAQQGPLSVDLKNNLLGYWPLNGTAVDIGGNALHGEMFDAEAGEDRFGDVNGCLNFNGVSSRVAFGNVFSTLGTRNSPVTISFWFKSPTNKTAGKYNLDPMGTIISDFNRHGNSCETNFFICLTLNDDTKGLVWDQRGEGHNFGTLHEGNFINNQWYHVVLTMDGKGLKRIFLNGQEVKRFNYLQDVSFKEKNDNLEPDWQLGAMHFNNGEMSKNYVNYFQGKIDDLGIWNRELNENEIKELNLMKGGIIPQMKNKIEIAIFPNPANSEIQIKSNHPIVSENFIIYDMAGKRVMDGVTNGKIDISQIMDGSYILKLNQQAALFIKSDGASNTLNKTN